MKRKKKQVKNGVNVFCRTRTVEEKKIRINEKWCCEVSGVEERRNEEKTMKNK
jgi:hypothetical protein